MKSIREALLNGNKFDAINMLYELPLTKYPELIELCTEDAAFGSWVSKNLSALLADNSQHIDKCGDIHQFKQTEKARNALVEEKPAKAMEQLQANSRTKPNRLVRRAVRLTGSMLFNHGLAGLDKVIGACNSGMENE